MATVLIVEDEIKILERLRVALQADGHQVETISDEEAFSAEAVSRLRPHLIILDRLLGQRDSLGQVREIKKRLPGAGLLILSAIDSPLEKAKALELGADDYLAKPFSMTELLARVKALQRRAVPVVGRPEFLSLGRAVLDLEGRLLMIEGKRHHLPNKEFGILRLLGASPGRVFNKIQILEAVWDTSYDVESNAVETAITALRRRLEELQSGIAIKNSRNMGYWLEAQGL